MMIGFSILKTVILSSNSQEHMSLSNRLQKNGDLRVPT